MIIFMFLVRAGSKLISLHIFLIPISLMVSLPRQLLDHARVARLPARSLKGAQGDLCGLKKCVTVTEKLLLQPGKQSCSVNFLGHSLHFCYKALSHSDTDLGTATPRHLNFLATASLKFAGVYVCENGSTCCGFCLVLKHFLFNFGRFDHRKWNHLSFLKCNLIVFSTSKILGLPNLGGVNLGGL